MIEGERIRISGDGGSFVPRTSDFDLAIRSYELRKGDHVQRYRFASSAIGLGSVLDLGCGHGLGAAFLCADDRSYVGVDEDAQAIAWATRTIAGRIHGSRFLTSEQFDRPGEAGRFDAIVLLEVLEHVPDARLLLEQIRSRLKENGRLILSTPNGYLSEGSSTLHQSPFHTREYTATQLLELLSSSGFRGTLFEQHRLDHLDSVPQLAKRALLRIPHSSWGQTAVPNSSSENPHPVELRRRLTLAYRPFELAPGWEALWSVRPLVVGRAHDWAYSHILATASPAVG